ncbi:hypothetical protein BJ912DRAFT_994732 [Pholiota molesta]|nr:hypothetical protein BJ912DRAFT_994732 [Pholiota molesta]
MNPNSSVATSSRTLGHPDVTIFEAAEPYDDADAPSLIVLFGWMDAITPLLMKYVQGHRTLFPGSTIVLVKSSSNFMLTSEAERKRTLVPLADLILDRVYYADPTSGILFHVISNGGGFQLIYLSTLLSRRLARKPPATPSPPIGLIIDSAPGSGEYVSMFKTFTTSVRSPAAKAILHLPLSLMYAAYVVMTAVRGMPPLLPLLRARLQEAAVVPTADGATPRLYVFSDADGMVADADIEAHLRDIARLGFNFQEEKYSGSQHVSHMKKDPERYWRAVREVWKSAQKVAADKSDTYKAKL